jgi:biopolymer transport protein TolQ
VRVLRFDEMRRSGAPNNVAEERLLRTPGCFGLALSQLQGTLGPDTGMAGPIGLVRQASPEAQVVLVILVLFSIASWAIILYKLWSFRRAERQSAQFLNVFRRSSKFSEVQAVCKSLEHSPLVGIFQAAYAELNSQLRHSTGVQQAPAVAGGNPQASVARPTVKSLQALDRALLRASTVEVNRLERRVPFLATTASITPFIGLFGTVWGIMTAFERIGRIGSTSLGVVAPGIAEALIATAAGLFAAIPAVYFYNHFAQHVKLFASEMDNFSLEFLNIAERNFT